MNKKSLHKMGGEVLCFMADEDVAGKAKSDGTTRAAASMVKAAGLGRDCILLWVTHRRPLSGSMS